MVNLLAPPIEDSSDWYGATIPGTFVENEPFLSDSDIFYFWEPNTYMSFMDNFSVNAIVAESAWPGFNFNLVL